MTKENITERVKGGGVSTSMGGSSSMPVKTGGSGGRNNPTTTTTTKTPIRKIDPKQFDNRSAAVTTNTPTGGSLKAGSFGISKAGRDQAAQNRAEFKAKIDAVKASSNKSSTPVVSDKTKQGKPRTKAQMMAAKRIASGKTIADVKKSNTDAMRARAAERFADFKAKREAKRLERMKKEEYTPYDMVLEYLLSTEQVATIEEANYVMMQLDEENIQEIVGTVAKAIMKTPLVKLVPAAIGTGIATKMIASRMGKKSGENQIKNSTPIPKSTPMPTKKSDPIKDLIPNIKKRNKALEDAIEKS